MTQLKNEARRALRRAWKRDESVSTIQPLAAKFLSLLRDHSRLKRASARRLHQKDVPRSPGKNAIETSGGMPKGFSMEKLLARPLQSSQQPQHTLSSLMSTSLPLTSFKHHPGCRLLPLGQARQWTCPQSLPRSCPG